MAAAKTPMSIVFVFSVRLCIGVEKLPVCESERTSAMEIWLISASRCMINQSDEYGCSVPTCQLKVTGMSERRSGRLAVPRIQAHKRHVCLVSGHRHRLVPCVLGDAVFPCST